MSILYWYKDSGHLSHNRSINSYQPIKFSEIYEALQWIEWNFIKVNTVYLADLEDGDIGLLSVVLRCEQHGVLVHKWAHSNHPTERKQFVPPKTPKIQIEQKLEARNRGGSGLPARRCCPRTASSASSSCWWSWSDPLQLRAPPPCSPPLGAPPPTAPPPRAPPPHSPGHGDAWAGGKEKRSEAAALGWDRMKWVCARGFGCWLFQGGFGRYRDPGADGRADRI